MNHDAEMESGTEPSKTSGRWNNGVMRRVLTVSVLIHDNNINAIFGIV